MVSNIANGPMQLGEKEFQEFRDYLEEIAGIDLGSNKQYLVATRIRRILIDYECNSLTELTALVKKPGRREVRQRVIDAMTTNETFWFRDLYPFDYLRRVILPEHQQKNPGVKLRIWSAACSSGQEPYSISITIEEYIKSTFGVVDFPSEIMATDLSSEILAQAKSGIYDKLAIARGLSSQRQRENFKPIEGDCWQINDKLKRRVQFNALNLLDNFSIVGKFDIIFCRNVLIYFSAELKQDILRRLGMALKPGGYLFLGSSESLSRSSDNFEMVHCNPGVMYRDCRKPL